MLRISRFIINKNLFKGDARNRVRGCHRLQAGHPQEGDKAWLHRNVGGGREIQET